MGSRPWLHAFAVFKANSVNHLTLLPQLFYFFWEYPTLGSAFSCRPFTWGLHLKRCCRSVIWFTLRQQRLRCKPHVKGRHENAEPSVGYSQKNQRAAAAA